MFFDKKKLARTVTVVVTAVIVLEKSNVKIGFLVKHHKVTFYR